MPHRAYSITNAISKMSGQASIWMLVAATIYIQTRLSMRSATSSSYENLTVPFPGHAPAKSSLPIKVSPSSASISPKPRTSASVVDSLSRLLPVSHQRDLTILKTVRSRKRPLKVTMFSDIWRTSLTSICPSNSSMQDISNQRPVKVVGLNRSSWIWAYHRVFLTQMGHVSRCPGMGVTMPPCRPTIIAAPRCLLCRAIPWKQKTRFLNCLEASQICSTTISLWCQTYTCPSAIWSKSPERMLTTKLLGEKRGGSSESSLAYPKSNMSWLYRVPQHQAHKVFQLCRGKIRSRKVRRPSLARSVWSKINCTQLLWQMQNLLQKQ